MSTDLEATLGGTYEVLHKIAEGGMGAVYKVRHRLLDEVRAVKVLRAPIAEELELQERFNQEAKTAVRLRHPGIAAIYDFNVAEDGTAYIVMEFVDGGTLEALLRLTGHPSVPFAAVVCEQALQALEYLHAQNIVLRDVAPDNFLVTRDSADRPVCKLIDLGIAKSKVSSTTVNTEPGVFVGKLRYASPEHFGGEVTHLSDIYSFGVLMYELLTGVYPFKGEGLAELMLAHVNKHPLSFDETDPGGGLPTALRELVLRALEKDPNDRIQSAGEYARLLQPFANDSSRTLKRELDAVLDAYRGQTTTSNREATLTAALPTTQPPARPPARPTSPPEVAKENVFGGTVIAPYSGLGKEEKEALPAQVGQFTLLEFVAEGRTGKLYKAYDPVLGRLVGLKVIRDTSGVAQQRLLRGARIWLDLQHENLLRVLQVDLGDAERPALVVTELIEGTDLRRASQSRRFSLEEKLSIVAQLCEALAYMHGKGVIHREIKPSNILVSTDTSRITLLDSGIARRANPSADDLTQVGAVIGDLNYMAPEQASGRFDERSDLFSVGCVLYELLTGREPSFLQLERMRDEIAEEVHPRQLRSTNLKALSLDPEMRHSRAEEMGDELRELVPREEPRLLISRES